jgi:hypothetical protein
VDVNAQRAISASSNQPASAPPIRKSRNGSHANTASFLKAHGFCTAKSSSASSRREPNPNRIRAHRKRSPPLGKRSGGSDYFDRAACGRGPVSSLLTLTSLVWTLDSGADGSIYLDQVDRPVSVLRFRPEGGHAERIATVIGETADDFAVLPDGRTALQELVAGRIRLMILETGKDPVPLVNTAEETAVPESSVKTCWLTRSRRSAGLLATVLGTPMYLKTVPKRGYRFVADVQEVSSEALVATEQITTIQVQEEYYDEPPRRKYSRSAFAAAALAITLTSVAAVRAPAWKAGGSASAHIS